MPSDPIPEGVRNVFEEFAEAARRTEDTLRAVQRMLESGVDLDKITQAAIDRESERERDNRFLKKLRIAPL